MANLLGNDTLGDRIAANLALTYGRLGRLDDQLKCAEERRRGPGTGGASWADIQLTYSVAYVHGISSRTEKALRAIEELDSKLGSEVTAPMRQRWLLWKADVLMVSGLPADAFRVAREAIHADQPRLDSSAFAGPFARWVALVCADANNEQQGLAVLAQLEEHLEEFDAVDQLEILCAVAHCDPTNAHSYYPRIAQRLENLPGSVARQISILGIDLGACLYAST